MDTNDNFDPFEPIGLAADRLVKLMQDFLENPHKEQKERSYAHQKQRSREAECDEEQRRPMRSAKE